MSTINKQKKSIGPGKLILQVGVIGNAGKEEYPKNWKPHKDELRTVKTIGQLLGKAGATVLTGGAQGIMSTVSTEAIKGESITVGLFNHLEQRGASEEYTVGLNTGMKEGALENLLTMFSDIMIAIGGCSGTLNELCMAYRNKIPVVLLKGYGGWVDNIIPLLHKGKYLDVRERTEFYIAETPEDAVRTALRIGKKRLIEIKKKGKNFYKNTTTTSK
ncbi:hypothetical protein HN419_06200 [Candidatus Woesearchaeota archaeon]|jgi:uncharacterized protein (TIGR00725 family)|nr:hypothetical protein [Candidatus Woesearchaeota archaeon]MBT3538086.1 hypothetical protein [Candidatus Woesearchaeota archaeon]MBT4697293.1 hypothetical protein [Candidatus Woesearchaeota archaeon]MBT7105755.1 hypothetical protein [Candidatus Woesearchaeota archaeon]MBT7930592.1 hypothetical protein [Candidatus Woesearchaeota archaeon]